MLLSKRKRPLHCYSLSRSHYFFADPETFNLTSKIFLSLLRYPNLIDDDVEDMLWEYLAAPDQATKSKSTA